MQAMRAALVGVVAMALFGVGLVGSAAPVEARTAAPEVHRVAGGDRFATAAALSAASYPDGADLVMVATGTSFPDALAGGPAVAGIGPVLLVTRDTVPEATRREIARLRPALIVVLGGTGAVSEVVVRRLDDQADEGAIRIAGSNRFATAAELAVTAFEPGVPLAVVASGEDFADALAGGALAGGRASPVLLTGRDDLPAPTAQALRELKPGRIVVVGGATRVSDTVLTQLSRLTRGEVQRHSGPDRFATAVAISREELRRSRTVFIATGRSFPDALAASATAGAMRSPLLLVTADAVPPVVRCELQRLVPEDIVLLGGSAAVSIEVEEELAAGYPKGAGPCAPPEELPVPGGNGTVPSIPTAPATGYQLNAANTGSVADGSRAAVTLERRWSAELGGPTSFPVVAGGRLFVTLRRGGDIADYGSDLVALDAATGQQLWRDRLVHRYFESGLAFDAGTLYVLGGGGLLQARDPSTGRVRWTGTVNDTDTPPTAVNGRVYVSGNAGVQALDGRTGSLLWTAPLGAGQKSTPAVTRDGVYVSYSCNNAFGFVPATGSLLWRHTGQCVGGGGRTVAVHDGLLYTRDFDGNLVLDALTGRPVGSHPGTRIPALWDHGGVFVGNGDIYGRDSEGVPRWQLLGEQATSAPIIVNGAAYVGTATGRLLALDATNGSVLWEDVLGSPVPVPDEHNVSQPLTGFAAGEGLLVVPTLDELVVYGPASAPVAPSAGLSALAITPDEARWEELREAWLGSTDR
jgi:outer membrane protein assembly factor BamB/putative cell wall-binding protein